MRQLDCYCIFCSKLGKRCEFLDGNFGLVLVHLNSSGADVWRISGGFCTVGFSLVVNSAPELRAFWSTFVDC